MGSLRTLLAISVLITHSSTIFGIRLLNGDIAVICFFIISGFLITLILNEKYQDLKAFYINRGLRIYAPYFSALVLSVVIYLVISKPNYDPVATYAAAFHGGDALWLVWSTISNLTLVGIDLLRYVSVQPDFGILFPSFLHLGQAGGTGLLFVPQAWTLAIELQFYLVAPFLVRLRVAWLLPITAFFVIAQIVVSYRLRAEALPLDDSAIFPMMLGYFLLGALAYHGYRLWRGARLAISIKRGVSAVMLLLGLAMVFTGYGLLHDLPVEDYVWFYLAMTAVLPFAFYLTKDWRWDSRVGDYSYPIYVFHFVVNSLVVALGADQLTDGPWVLLVTVAISAVFLHFVDAPVQRIRRRIASRSLMANRSTQPVPA